MLFLLVSPWTLEVQNASLLWGCALAHQHLVGVGSRVCILQVAIKEHCRIAVNAIISQF